MAGFNVNCFKLKEVSSDGRRGNEEGGGEPLSMRKQSEKEEPARERAEGERERTNNGGC